MSKILLNLVIASICGSFCGTLAASLWWWEFERFLGFAVWSLPFTLAGSLLLTIFYGKWMYDGRSRQTVGRLVLLVAIVTGGLMLAAVGGGALDLPIGAVYGGLTGVAFIYLLRINPTPEL